MNSTIDPRVTVAVEKILGEIHRLRTLVPDPDLLEFLATSADMEGQYYQASLARDLARRIREWDLTLSLEEDK